MVEKRLSEFDSVTKSDVTDIIVLYDDDGTTKNGKLDISQLDSAYAVAEYDVEGNEITETYLRKDDLPFDLFDTKWTDYVLNSQMELRSDTFAWQDGTVYTESYNHLVNDYQNSIEEILWSHQESSIDLGNYVSITNTPSGLFALSHLGYASTSTDGINWTQSSQIFNEPESWMSVAYGNNIYMAITYTPCKISTSQNGLTWSTPTIKKSSMSGINCLCYGDGKFIASGGTRIYITSDNGENWTSVNSPFNTTKIIYGNNRFLAYNVSQGGLVVSYSSDGINWSEAQTIQGLSGDYRVIFGMPICFDGNKFVAVAKNGYTMVSTDGVNWSEHESPIEFEPRNIVYINGMYIASDDRMSYISESIEYYQAQDGHKIILPDRESFAQNIYNESGVTGYYILDTANQRFKLPRTKYGFVGLRSSVGNYVPESLPNITGRIDLEGKNSAFLYMNNAQGAFTKTMNWYTEDGSRITGESSTTRKQPDLVFDASDCSSSYQDGAPVQQRATQMYLYFLCW